MDLRESGQVAPFHFCIGIGEYTGMSAASYKDFMTSIKKVEAKSLNFHIERGDFQKWILDIFKDEKLASEIEQIQKQNLQGRALRTQLYRIVSKRYKELNSKKR